ncbi:MAG: hypothetical protein K2X47_10775 [Bdellovibrionales bacterium]|nr:hypothetical protein [Bdellovibrionales bacterium]
MRLPSRLVQLTMIVFLVCTFTVAASAQKKKGNKRSNSITIQATDLPVESGENIGSNSPELTPTRRAARPSKKVSPQKKTPVKAELPKPKPPTRRKGTPVVTPIATTEATPSTGAGSTTEEEATTVPVKDLTPEERKQRESAIDKIVVATFRIDLENKKEIRFFKKSVDEIQKVLVEELNQKSYLAVSPLNQNLSLDEGRDTYKDTARETGADGIVAGEIRQNHVILSLRSGQSGRVLSKWTVPYVHPVTEGSFKDLMSDLVEVIVNGLPYRGFVTARKGRQVKINIGKSQALNIGQRIKVFEFVGDQNTFSSPQKILGEIEITRIASQAAIGKIIGDKKIPLFSKVAFDFEDFKASTDVKYRYYEDGWASLGAEFLYLDTVVDPATLSTSKRLFQLSLSPFLGVGVGKKNFAFFGRVGVASNPSSDVLFLIGDASYELLRTTKEKMGWIFSGGLQFRRYQVTENIVVAGLAKTQWILPYGEAYFHYTFSPRTKFFGAGKVLFPAMTQDEVLGSSNLMSFGIGATVGMRLDIGSRIGVEQTLNYERMFMSLANNTVLGEAQFGLRIRLFRMF